MRLSANYCSNLIVDLQAAGWAGLYLSVLSSGMLLSVLLSGLHPTLKISLFLALAGWTLLVWANRPGGIRTAVWQTSGDWRLQTGSGDWMAARLLHAWTAGPAFSVLSWRDESGTRQLTLVTPGVASEASRRRLSCHLRWRPRAVCQSRLIERQWQ